MSRSITAMGPTFLLLALVLVPSLRTQAPPPAADGWHDFTGTRSAAGQRHTLPTEGGGTAAIVRLSGAVVLDSGSGLGRGFRGEVISFNDGRAFNAGRWVWTDERGEQLFGEVKGEPMETGRRFVGTITGGRGRYERISGSYEFTWQHILTTDDGTVQGRTVGLKGRYRRETVAR